MSEVLSIDENLTAMNFPAPLIRQMNQAKHINAISLGIGQLWKWFDTAPEVLGVLSQLGTGDTSIFDYWPNAGTWEFRQAVAENQWKKDRKKYGPENVLSTIGVQNAVQVALGTLNNLWTKRVLIPEVNFGIYKKIPASFGMQVETYKLTWDFGVDLEYLSGIMQEDDIIILNPVANPTGRVLNSQELQELATLLNEKLPKWYVISDEIYDELVYDTGVETGSFSKYFDRTIVCNGVSKSGAMAWVRVGWVVSENAKLIEAMTWFNTNQISSPSPLNQALALPVVRGETQTTIDGYNNVLLDNRARAMMVLNDMWLPYHKPEWSFYIFPKISDTIKDVKQACLDAAWNPEWVVVIPWVAFWAERNVRISLASIQSDFRKWMERFKKLFS